MANTYIKLCSEFSITDRVAQETRLRELNVDMMTYYDGDSETRPSWMPDTVMYDGWLTAFEQINVISADGDCKVEVATDYGPDFDAVGCVLKELLKLEPAGTQWRIPFAETCDRLRTGAFGGGMMIVTSTGYGLYSITLLVDTLCERLGMDYVRDLFLS